ncbi:MAG: tol-pal system protein YbgF [Alphaproteobacteria bacterium]
MMGTASGCTARRVTWVVVLGALVFAFTKPVLAQSSELQPLIDTINRLQTQLNSLERSVYQGQPPPSVAPQAAGELPASTRALAQLQVRISQFEDELRSLTGQIEQLDFNLRQASTRLDKLVRDVDFRLRALEQGRTPEQVAEAEAPEPVEGTAPAPARVPSAGTVVLETPVQGPTVEIIGQVPVEALPGSAEQLARVPGGAEIEAPAPEAGAGPAAAGIELPEGSVDEQYNYARSFLMRRDFQGAEVALRAFIDANPNAPLAGNAQYWLGETYYVRNDYQNAAQAFARGYESYPNSAKAPDNLLKLGLSLAALDRTRDACITLAELRGKYPAAPANILRRAEREHQRLDCG